MKTMTCRQLGGACDKAFHGNTFEEIVKKSKRHGMEMAQAGDKNHLKAMDEMKNLMSSPDAMTEWMQQKRKEFQAIADE